jgi:competence protein ComEC
VPLLRDLGVERLAAVVVSHPHPDHVLGLAAVAQAFPVDRLVLGGSPARGASAEVLAGLPPPERLRRGEGWERAGVRFVSVGSDDPDFVENDASLVLRVEHGAVALLFPGDVEEAGEAATVAAGGPLRADLVKVPHHGSRRSSTVPFTQAVSPAWAVVSIGAFNRYGFPHAEAEARWRATGAAWLRTDEGAVRFLSDGKVLRRVPAADAVDALAVWRERAAGGAP